MDGLRIVLLATLLGLGSSCENPFLQVGSRCLLFGSSFSFDYTTSIDFCTTLNGKLVKIDDPGTLREIVDYTTNNLTEGLSYWLDGKNEVGTWLFADGSSVPLGTPYWATYSVSITGFAQEPRPGFQGSQCLAIKHNSSYYFVTADCTETLSPICEEMTTTLGEVDAIGTGNTGQMFSMEHNFVCVDGSQNHFHYNTPTGNIISPCYPDRYASNLAYTWQISVEERYYISLIVVTFETRKDSDIVQIRDGASGDSPVLSELSGFIETGYEILSSNNQLLISFTSTDVDENKSGFDFIWTSKKSCAVPFITVGSMCLHIEINEMTFGMAAIACQESSGVLATIKDAKELRQLYEFLHSQGIADYDFWLGATDAETEGTWTWKDGSAVPQGTPFWGTTGSSSEIQEPDGGQEENCLLLASSGFHFFRDTACDTKAPALCMYVAE